MSLVLEEKQLEIYDKMLEKQQYFNSKDEADNYT
jgi:hypothetical protein